MSLDLPIEGLQEVVPSAFRIVAGFTPATGGVLLVLQDCERSLDNGTVYGATRILETWVFVEPRNDSWSVEGHSDFYLLDIAVENPGILQFLGNHSLNGTLASFSEIDLPVPGGLAMHEWTVSSGSWNATLAFPRVADPTPQDLDFRASLWYGTGPFARVALERAHTTDSLLFSAGALLVIGESKLRTAMIAPAIPSLVASSRDVDNLLVFDGKWFD